MDVEFFSSFIQRSDELKWIQQSGDSDSDSAPVWRHLFVNGCYGTLAQFYLASKSHDDLRSVKEIWVRMKLKSSATLLDLEYTCSTACYAANQMSAPPNLVKQAS